MTAIGDIFQISVMAVRIWSLYSWNLCNSHYWYFQNKLLWEVSPMTVSKSFLEFYAQVTVITDIRCCQMKPKSDGLPEISAMAVMKESSLFSSHVTVISDISLKEENFTVFCYSHYWHFQNLSNSEWYGQSSTPTSRICTFQLFDLNLLPLARKLGVDKTGHSATWSRLPPSPA